MSWRRLIWLVPAVGALVVLIAWRWLLYSSSGAAWVLGLARDATNGAIQVESVEGAIVPGLTVGRFSFENESIRIEVADIVLTAEPHLLPLTVAVRDARVSDVDVELRSREADPEEETNLRDVLRSLNLPLSLEFHDVRVADVQIRGAGIVEPLQIDSGQFSAKWDDRIEIDSFTLDAPAGAISARGDVSLNDEHELALEGHVDLEPVMTGADEVIRVDVDADGSLDRIEFDVQSMNSSLTGRLIDLTGELSVDARLESPMLGWPLVAADPTVVLQDVSLSVEGRLSAYRAAGEASVGLPGLQMIDVVLDGAGDESRFDAQSVAVNGGEAEGSVVIGWRDGVSVSGDARLNSLELNRWIEDWTGAHVLDGTLSATVAAGDLNISESNIVVVDGERRLELDGGIDVSGSADQWTLAGEVGVATIEFPSGRFVLSGSGTREEIVLDQLSGSLLGGTVEGLARFSWVDSRPWSAALDIRNIDTGSLPFDWPANISGRIDAEGQVQPIEAVVTLHDIDGSLRSTTFSAAGTVGYAAGDISARNLDVRHGDSRVYLDGELTGTGGFSFDARVSEIGDYIESGSGSFVLAGRASLNSDNSFFDAVGSSEQLTWGDLSLVDVRLRNGQGEGLVADIDLDVGSLTQGAYTLESIAVTLDIGKDQQVAALSAAMADLRIGVLAAGALDDWASPSRWAGEISQFDIVEGDRSASLVQPSDIEIGKAEVALSGFCLESAYGLYACADFRRNVSGALELATELRSLPVNIVNQFVDTRLTFDQTISGKFDWRQSASGRINGSADIDLTAGMIINQARPESPVVTEAGGVSFDIVDNDLQSGLIALPLPAGGRVDGQFVVDDVEDGGDAEVEGNLTIDLPDLAAIDSLIPWLDELSGSLYLESTVDGTVRVPVISGEAALLDGAIRYEPVGLRLSDVEFRSNLDADGQLQLSGSFRAGEGTGEISTRGQSGDSPGVEVALRGTNLTLIDLPDLMVITEPDVVVGFDGTTLSLNGRVLVPTARVRPQNISVTRVTESRDVVIVAGELPPSVSGGREAGDLRIEGDLDVAFGNDVSIRLDVARTNLTGSTTFTWTGEPVPMANGRYDLTGTIVAFGQRLEIDEGGIRFPDVRADNPVIRIRAIRDIFGNTEVRQAGVQFAGSVRRPTVETFTVPATTEERALTLLITGSDFDYEQGVGAVDFGTYIAPRLYASYGIGLFDQENVIRLRYDVARGFGVTVTSGQKENGLDLTYRFEN